MGSSGTADQRVQRDQPVQRDQLVQRDQPVQRDKKIRSLISIVQHNRVYNWSIICKPFGLENVLDV